MFQEARRLAAELGNKYCRLYYEGLICERRAKAHLRLGGPSSGYMAHDWLLKAMELYEAAEPLRPEKDDAVLLRWNACVRAFERHPDLEPEPLDDTIQLLE